MDPAFVFSLSHTNLTSKKPQQRLALLMLPTPPRRMALCRRRRRHLLKLSQPTLKQIPQRRQRRLPPRTFQLMLTPALLLMQALWRFPDLDPDLHPGLDDILPLLGGDDAAPGVDDAVVAVLDFVA